MLINITINMPIMGVNSEWKKFPFGVLQKTYHRLTKSEENISKGICANPICHKHITKQGIYCSEACYNYIKYERLVASTWKE